jgi:hypothetical protein
MVLAVMCLLGPLSAEGQAQVRPPAINPAMGLSLNPLVNPFAASALVGPQRVLAASALTHPLAATAGAGFGFNSALRVGALAGMNNGILAANNPLGYGSLLNGGSGIYGGSGGLASSLLSSAAYGAGYSYGSYTQWMMNPYQGYLQGAADLTRSNAQYEQTIQQARMTRQEAIRSSLETRRALIEEADWERAHMPDPEKIRQRTLERELSVARVSPPPNDIWSGRTLNTLLRHLITQRGEDAREPHVPISEDAAKHINVKVGDAVGNVALLKNKGELEWPESLQGSAFKESREQFNTLMQGAYRSVNSGTNPAPATLYDLRAQFRKMRATLTANVRDLKPDEYIEARRYLDELGQTIAALKDPNIGKQFRDDWKPKARDVAQLVKHMREKGLMFAPATEKDEAAYVALYRALAAFDAGLGQGVSGARGNPDASDNK